MRRSALAVAALLVGSLTAAAQLQSGTVTGTITDQTGAVLPGVNVTLENRISAHVSVTTSNDRGEFVINNVPFDSYTLRLEARGFLTVARAVSVRSSIPVRVSISLAVTGTRESLTVEAREGLVEADSSGTETEVPEDLIRHSPGLIANHQLQSLVTTTPGWLTEDNGLSHIRGVDDGILYVVDGIPRPDRLDALFASPPDTELLKSMDVITGNLPPEFGERSGAVVVVQPRSGLDTPLTGSFTAGQGNFNASELAATVGGGTKTIGAFLATSVSRSARFLDPVDPRNFHDDGGAVGLFLRGDWYPTAKDTLLFSGGTDGSDFQVPNTLDQQVAGQRERQELQDYDASLN